MQIAEGIGSVPQKRKARWSFDWAGIVNSDAFWPAVITAIGVAAIFWSLFAFTFNKWMDAEGYYTHGFLVPFISGYIVFRWWPKLKQVPVRAGWVGIPFLLLSMWVAFAANRTDIYFLLSVTLIICLMFASWIIAGWRWMVALVSPIGYLLFGLPVWDQVINNYTNPLQLISTKVAFYLLQLFAMSPVQKEPTIINLSNYQLEVAVACSGLKLLLALVAFGVFFMLIAKLKVWANIVFAASIIPLALFINGLRIALIGVVGNTWGENAGKSFHDYSGYIVIILCFFILDRWAKLLGWKNQPLESDPAKTQTMSPVQKSGLKKRAFAVAGLFVLCGAVIIAAPKPKAAPGRTEAWMESKAPLQIDNYKVTSTYKMDPSTYAELQPYGIVCRIFTAGVESYDVTLVASNRKTSFHDPRVCFPAQGWSFNDQQKIMIQTQTRGVIPATLITMEGDDHSQQLAAYFYRDRKGFYPSPQGLSWSMFIDQFAGRTDNEGVFYRFMPNHKGATVDQLTHFIERYMDEAPKTSGGYF
jgi:exosortase